MAIGDPGYEKLLGEIFRRQAELDPLSVLPKAAEGTSKMGRIKGFFGPGGIRKTAGSVALWLALGQILNTMTQGAERGIRREAIRGQAELATPENLYYQAALPTVQAEEEQARQALFAQISGGVIGPSLARGERLIGR